MTFTGKALESNYEVRSLAFSLGLLQDFGPQPSINMLLDDIQKMTFADHVAATLHQPTLFCPVTLKRSWTFAFQLPRQELPVINIGETVSRSVVHRLSFDDSPSSHMESPQLSNLAIVPYDTFFLERIYFKQLFAQQLQPAGSSEIQEIVD